jgi:hypothetical protein
MCFSKCLSARRVRVLDRTFFITRSHRSQRQFCQILTTLTEGVSSDVSSARNGPVYHTGTSFCSWNSYRHFINIWRRGSSVSIVSECGQAIEVRSPANAKRIFPLASCVQTGSGAHPASCTMGTGGPLPGVNRNLGMALTTHPHLVPK